METKIIKEEVPDKEFSDSDKISTLRNRSKSGSTSTGKQQPERSNTCKTPDSPEGARLSAAQLPAATTISSQAPLCVARRSSLSPNPSSSLVTSRPTSQSPSLSRLAGVNGTHSPVHGGSPDTLAVTTTPPLSLSLDAGHGVANSAGHAATNYLAYNPLRQLNKVKRFLCTLVQFGADIGQEIGDRVRSLVLSLVSSNLSIEEFHQALQDVTNFPLRPFVLPFLRTHLPLLQREIHSLARASKQSSLQYVRTHDHIVLDPTFSPSEASEIFLSSDAPISAKRRSSDSYYENGQLSNGQTSAISSTITTQQNDSSSIGDYSMPMNKRQMTHYPQNPFLLSTAMSHHSSLFLPNLATISSMPPNLPPIDPYGHQLSNPTQPLTLSNRAVETDTNDVTNSTPYRNLGANPLVATSNRGDEEWKNIHVMLNCILSMVEKTKRALAILQQRNSQDQSTEWLRKQDIGIDLKKAANEIMAQAIRQTENRVAEVKRKAEEAVSEVKKQAVIELQKAVQLAESKACELVANERAKMEKMLNDARKPSNEEANTSQNSDGHDNSQSPPISSVQAAPSSQNACWNCGRKANETCSGCNVARYCGAFCQHKDWENHHAVCCQQTSLAAVKLSAMVSAPIPSGGASKHGNVNSTSKTVNAPAAAAARDAKPQRVDGSGARASTPVSSSSLTLANPRSSRDADRAAALISK